MTESLCAGAKDSDVERFLGGGQQIDHRRDGGGRGAQRGQRRGINKRVRRERLRPHQQVRALHERDVFGGVGRLDAEDLHANRAVCSRRHEVHLAVWELHLLPQGVRCGIKPFGKCVAQSGDRRSRGKCGKNLVVANKTHRPHPTWCRTGPR